MTLAEFKAWFEGFSELMGGPPNEDQWKRIQARVKEIDGQVTTYPVFIDRYVERVRPYWDWSKVYGGTPTFMGSTPIVGSDAASFNANTSMIELGRAEYKAALAS